MNLKVPLVVAAISMSAGNSYGVSGPTTCMNCKLSSIDGESTACTTRCKDCCESECIDFSKECGGMVLPTGCDAGKYGSVVCQSCPADERTHANVTSDMLLNTVVTGCYIPNGSAFYDDTGSGTYGGNCYYSN